MDVGLGVGSGAAQGIPFAQERRQIACRAAPAQGLAAQHHVRQAWMQGQPREFLAMGGDAADAIQRTQFLQEFPGLGV